MKIEEAKSLFMQANANLSCLKRDGLYDEFMLLRISEETLEQWKKELISNYKKIITGTSFSLNVKLHTIYQFDEMDCEDGENYRFILDYYISHKEMDVFSQILFCEVLSKPEYKELLLSKGIDLQEHIDCLIETVRKNSFMVDISYKDDPFLEEEDFMQDKLFERIMGLKNNLNHQTESKQKSFWKRMFKKKT